MAQIDQFGCGMIAKCHYLHIVYELKDGVVPMIHLDVQL